MTVSPGIKCTNLIGVRWAGGANSQLFCFCSLLAPSLPWDQALLRWGGVLATGLKKWGVGGGHDQGPFLTFLSSSSLPLELGGYSLDK